MDDKLCTQCHKKISTMTPEHSNLILEDVVGEKPQDREDLMMIVKIMMNIFLRSTNYLNSSLIVLGEYPINHRKVYIRIN